MVRTTNTTETKYNLYGVFLTEKFKKEMYSKGLKDRGTGTWADVFPHCDVVYRFNPTKHKLDVFVGAIQAVKYASGKVRAMRTNAAAYTELSTFPGSKTYFLIDQESVKRDELL